MSASRLQRRTLFCYSAGSLVETTLYGFCGLYLMNFYTDEVHLDPRLIGYAFSIRFLADALTDPFIGYLSDRTTTRAGRRRPYFLAGSIPAAFCFYLLLTPPQGTEMQVFAWLTITSSLLITSLTIYGIPYLALSFELSPDYDERTRIAGWRRGFEVLGEILATLSIPVLLAVAAATNNSSAEMSVDESDYYPMAAVILGTLAVMAATLSLFGTRESGPAPTPVRTRLPVGIRQAYRNRPFVILLVAFTLVAVADRTATSLLLYLLEYLHGVPAQDSVVPFLIYFAGSLASPYAWIRLSQLLGKKKTYLIAMACWAFAFGAFAISPWTGIALYVVIALMGATSSGVLILPGAILPDVIEWEQVRTGERREGIYAGIAKFSWKIATALCFLVIGHLLHLIGYDGQAAPTPDVLQGLQLVCLSVLGLLIPAAMLTFHRFPLTASAYSQLRQQIEGEVAPSH